MKDIGPGSLVRCDRGEWTHSSYRDGLNAPQKNVVYTIRDIIAGSGKQKGMCGYLLQEIRNRQALLGGKLCEVSFNAESFTPIDDKDIAIFRQLVADPPKELVE